MDIKVVKLLQTLPSKFNIECHLIGGAIRDTVINGKMETADYDFVISDKLIEILEFCSTQLKVKYHYESKYQTGKIKLTSSGYEIDFVQTRKEIYEKPGALPIVSIGNVEEDLLRRDFTINTLRVRVEDIHKIIAFDNTASRQYILDSLEGMKDLNKGYIRVLHKKSFIDDPTRLYRALRYAAKIGGRLEEETESLFKDALSIGALKTISYTRKLNEIRRCLEDDKSELIVNLMQKYSLLIESFQLQKNFTGTFDEVLNYVIVTKSSSFEKFKLLTAIFLLDESDKVFSAFNWSKRKIVMVNDLIDEVRNNRYSLDYIKSAFERL